jgi:hypothetical protein
VKATCKPALQVEPNEIATLRAQVDAMRAVVEAADDLDALDMGELQHVDAKRMDRLDAALDAYRKHKEKT